MYYGKGVYIKTYYIVYLLHGSLSLYKDTYTYIHFLRNSNMPNASYNIKLHKRSTVRGVLIRVFKYVLNVVIKYTFPTLCIVCV